MGLVIKIKKHTCSGRWFTFSFLPNMASWAVYIEHLLIQAWLPDPQMCGSCWKWMVALSRKKFLCTAPWEESETLMRSKVLPVRWVEIQNKKSSSWDWGQQCFHLRKTPELLGSTSIHCQKIVLSSTWSNMKSHPCISQTASLSLPNPWKTARPTLLRYSRELNGNSS